MRAGRRATGAPPSYRMESNAPVSIAGAHGLSGPAPATLARPLPGLSNDVCATDRKKVNNPR